LGLFRRERPIHEQLADEAGLDIDGMDDELAVGFPEIMNRYRAGGSARSQSPWVEQLTGRPPRTFEEFVREHRDTFAGS